MFTGLVEAIGELSELKVENGLHRLAIRLTNRSNWEVALGDSIAVNGCCLTLARNLGEDGLLWFDVSQETLQRTNLGQLELGTLVNLERALQLGQRLGGHLVTGHVDCVGEVVHVLAKNDGWQLEVAIPRQFAKYLIPKGSICLDGVSLTVNTLEDQEQCSIVGLTLIPTTLAETTFDRLQVGQRLNVELDMVGKYIERFHRFQ